MRRQFVDIAITRKRWYGCSDAADYSAR